MNSAFRKIAAVIAGILVLVLIGGLVNGLEGQYQNFFPELSRRTLTNIESVSNIAGLILAVWLSIKTYKRLAIPKDE